MILKHIVDLGLLAHDPNSGVLDTFPLSVRRAIISEVSTYLFSTLKQREALSNSVPVPSTGSNFSCTTRTHLLWIMEVLGSGLCLPLEDIFLTANCISIYCTWLLEPSSRPMVMHAAPNAAETADQAALDANLTFYFEIIFRQLSCFFEFLTSAQMTPNESEISNTARRKQSPTLSPQEILNAMLSKKLECMKNVLLALSYLSQDPTHSLSKKSPALALLEPKMTAQGWDRLVRVLLGMADSLLSYIESASATPSMNLKIVDTLAEPMLWTLFEVWCRAGVQDKDLWFRFKCYIQRWTHRIEALLQWQSTVFGLTSRLLSLLYQNQGPVEASVADGPNVKFSVTLSTIYSLKLRPTPLPHAVAEKTITVEWPSLQYLYFAWYKFYFLLRDIDLESMSAFNYYCFVAGLQPIFDLFLKSSSLSSLLTLSSLSSPSPSISASASASVLPYSFTGSSVSLAHDSGRHHSLVSIAIGDWWKVIPSGNTLLELFGHWVYSASLCGRARSADDALHRRPSIAADAVDMDQGRAEGMAILIKLFNLKQWRQPFQASAIYHYYHALAASLSGSCGIPSTLTSLFFCANDLWSLFYSGLPFLAADFFSGIKQVLPLLYSSSSAQKSDYKLKRLDRITDEDYRRAIYKLLGQLLVLPGYYMDTLTPVSLNDLSQVADYMQAYEPDAPVVKHPETGVWTQTQGPFELKYIPGHPRITALIALVPVPQSSFKQEPESSHVVLCLPFSKLKSLVSELILNALDNEDHSPNLRYLLNILNVWIHDQGRSIPDLLFNAILFLSLKLRGKNWSSVVNQSAIDVLRQWFPLIRELRLSRQHECFGHLVDSLSSLLLEQWAESLDYSAKTADWIQRLVRTQTELMLTFTIASDICATAVQVICQGARLQLAKEPISAKGEADVGSSSLIQQARHRMEQHFYFQMWKSRSTLASLDSIFSDVSLFGASRAHRLSTVSHSFSSASSPLSISSSSSSSPPPPPLSALPPLSPHASSPSVPLVLMSAPVSVAALVSPIAAAPSPKDFLSDVVAECQLSLQRLFEREEHAWHPHFGRTDPTSQWTFLEKFQMLYTQASSMYVFEESALFTFLNHAQDDNESQAQKQECVQLCVRDFYEKRHWTASWQWVTKSYLHSAGLYRERTATRDAFPDRVTVARAPPASAPLPLSFNISSSRKTRLPKDTDSFVARLGDWQAIKGRARQAKTPPSPKSDMAYAIQPPSHAPSEPYLARLWTSQAGFLHPHHRQYAQDCPFSSNVLEKVLPLNANALMDLMALDTVLSKEQIGVNVYFASSGYCSLEEVLGLAKCDRDAMSIQAFHYYTSQLGSTDKRRFPDAVDGVAMSVFEDERVRMSFYFPLQFHLSRFASYVKWSNAYGLVRGRKSVTTAAQLFAELEQEKAKLEMDASSAWTVYLEGYMNVLSRNAASVIWLESEEGMLALPNTLASCSSSPSHLYLYILPLKKCHVARSTASSASAFVDGLAKIRVVIVGPIPSSQKMATKALPSGNNFLFGPLLDGMLIRLEHLAALVRATILSSHEFFSPDGSAPLKRRQAMREWISLHSRAAPHV